MTSFELPEGPRLLISAHLLPLQGQRFQPTGFPDVGAATFEANGSQYLLVESAQSVANRLESACWDEATVDLVEPLDGLPYVRVNTGEEGAFLTASVLEAHRLNSVYIEKSGFFEELKSAISHSDKRPVFLANLTAALAKYDVGCLLHGVFLESIAGTLRVPRALSGFIEAKGVQSIVFGGVKNDRVQPSKDEEAGRSAGEGFGNVPYHRTEYAAEEITAYFSLDLMQIRSYRLGAALERVLYALSVFKIRRFLETGLRLRTACDLEVAQNGLIIKRPEGFTLPSLADTEAALPKLIQAAKAVFASPAVTNTTFVMGEPKKTKGKRP